MRPLLPLALTALVLGCASESVSPPAGSGVSRRDLTLRAPSAPQLEVASAVELGRPMPEPQPSRRARISPKPAPVPKADPIPDAAPAFEAAAPIIVPAVAEAAVDLSPADASSGSGRELAPGRTVTIIPVSSGPSSAMPEDDSWISTERSRGIMVRGGGTCRPRGGVRGIGIGGRIPVGLRDGSLR